MAMTKAQLAAAVLKRLRVIGAGETATADDLALVEGAIDSVYPQLRKLGLAPFAVSSIDEWAERGMVKIVSGEIGPEFGHTDPGKNQLEIRMGYKELARAVAAEKRDIPTKAEYF